MRGAARVFGKSLFDAYQNLSVTIGVSLIWMVGILPIVTAGPVTAGMFYTIHRKKTADAFHFDDFLQGIKRFYKPTIFLFLLSGLFWAPALIYFVLLTQAEPTLITRLLSGALLYLMLMGALVQGFCYPLMVIQNRTDVGGLLRDTFLLVGKRPFFSIAVLIGIGLMTAVCLWIPLLLVTVWAGAAGWMMYYSCLYLMPRDHPMLSNIDWHVDWRLVLKPWLQ
ncbi:uncharacterized protein DUF624 [Melghirimyces profundicolus]|uniref:Uncharacterized protein DUF624 n=1 Tax=Melghirimyces profundicolus TaxID=1242148 RepID=A0A2T6C834_9BACL|nr:DUF624 domain-containing protein [Melghirimyces profundicolus]PTX64436.1 uncharacterized protein DUF624 [Melghirimyces profundicolus]